MSKKPSDMPEIGDKCCLRGRPEAKGILRNFNDLDWAAVDWDAGVRAPVIVSRYELKRITT